MLDNTWWPPDGHKNVKFNLRPTMPKPNALKTKSTNNIQVIELNILNKYY
jgi:hypothetical protein